MEWLASNWLWVTFVVGFIALHWFGHGGHGTRYGHHSPSAKERDPKSLQERAELSTVAGRAAHAGNSDAPSTGQGTRHRHGC
jgi:hypothetical protein